MKISNTKDMRDFIRSVEDRDNLELYIVVPRSPKIMKITKGTKKHLYAEDGTKLSYPSRSAGFYCFTSLSEAVRDLDTYYHRKKDTILNELKQLEPIKGYLEELAETHPQCFL